MNLKKAIGVMATNRLVTDSPTIPCDVLHNCLSKDSDDCMMSFRFEYNIELNNKKKPSKKRKVATRTPQTPQSEKKTPPITNRNPITELLASCQQKKCVDKVIRQKREQKQETKETEKHTSHHDTIQETAQTKPITITQASWNIQAIAPLIVWLQKKRIRCLYSDWVNEFSNGERFCLVSQHGVLLTNQHITKQKQYICRGPFHKIQLQCACNLITNTNTNTDWWKEMNCKQYLQNGILHSMYQRRTYLWDTHIYIHLNTIDGHTFNVVVEQYCSHNQKKNDKEDSSLQQLLSSLAYHFSQHINHQKRF